MKSHGARWRSKPSIPALLWGRSRTGGTSFFGRFGGGPGLGALPVQRAAPRLARGSRAPLTQRPQLVDHAVDFLDGVVMAEANTDRPTGCLQAQPFHDGQCEVAPV